MSDIDLMDFILENRDNIEITGIQCSMDVDGVTRINVEMVVLQKEIPAITLPSELFRFDD